MPTIPKYNQRRTNDLNYAKRRVVEAEKKGIAKLLNRSGVEYEDANKIAELLVKNMEDLVVLIQRLTGFIEIGESLTEDLDLALEWNLTSWELIDKINYPKVIGIIVASNLSLKRIVSLVLQFQKVFNFATPLNIQKIKDMYDNFIEYLNIYNSVSSQLLSSYKNIRNEINDDDVRSVISDLSDDSDDSDSTNMPLSVNVSASTISLPNALEQLNEKNFKKIRREIQTNMQMLERIFTYIFDNYNEERVQPEQMLAERKNIISEEYIGSGKTYSVGNKYSEQLYNTSGMYH